MPSRARAAGELTVGLIGLFAVVVFVPLSSPRFVAAVAIACCAVTAYAVYGATRFEGAAKWWGFVWGGQRHDDLARGLFNTGLLFVGSLVPIAMVKCFIRTPVVPHPIPYLFWCFAQDFLFFSIVMRGIERLSAGSVAGHRHVAVWTTAFLFGLSHFSDVRIYARHRFDRCFLGVYFPAEPPALAGDGVALHPRIIGHGLIIPI